MGKIVFRNIQKRGHRGSGMSERTKTNRNFSNRKFHTIIPDVKFEKLLYTYNIDKGIYINLAPPACIHE